MYSLYTPRHICWRKFIERIVSRGWYSRKLTFRRLRRKHRAELDKLADDDDRSARIAELNVHQAIDVLKEHPAVKSAAAHRGLTLHGMIFDLGKGQLRVLEEVGRKKGNGLWSPDN